MIALESKQSLFTVWRSRSRDVPHLFCGIVSRLPYCNQRTVDHAHRGWSYCPSFLMTYFAFKTHLEKSEENEHRQQLDQLYIRTVEALSAAIDAREAGTLGQAKQLQVYALAWPGKSASRTITS